MFILLNLTKHMHCSSRMNTWTELMIVIINYNNYNITGELITYGHHPTLHQKAFNIRQSGKFTGQDTNLMLPAQEIPHQVESWHQALCSGSHPSSSPILVLFHHFHLQQRKLLESTSHKKIDIIKIYSIRPKIIVHGQKKAQGIRRVIITATLQFYPYQSMIANRI